MCLFNDLERIFVRWSRLPWRETYLGCAKFDHGEEITLLCGAREEDDAAGEYLGGLCTAVVWRPWPPPNWWRGFRTRIQ